MLIVNPDVSDAIGRLVIAASAPEEVEKVLVNANDVFCIVGALSRLVQERINEREKVQEAAIAVRVRGNGWSKEYRAELLKTGRDIIYGNTAWRPLLPDYLPAPKSSCLVVENSGIPKRLEGYETYEFLLQSTAKYWMPIPPVPVE